MNRLKKIALFGADAIGKNDISFINNGDMIEVILNQNGMKKQPPDKIWNAKYYSGNNGDTIGFISYKIGPGSNSETDEEVCVIYVTFMEIRPEYSESYVYKYLLKYFQETVIDPAIEEHGKDNVYMHAKFANQELSESLYRISQKLGLKWVKDDSIDFSDESSVEVIFDNLVNEYYSFDAGIVNDNFNNPILKNMPASEVAEALQVGDLGGVIGYDNNIYLSKYSHYISQNGIGFQWEPGLVIIEGKIEVNQFSDFEYLLDKMGLVFGSSSALQISNKYYRNLSEFEDAIKTKYAKTKDQLIKLNRLFKIQKT